MSDSPVLVLHPSDNVVVCRRNVARGETLPVGNGSGFVIADADVALGHKIARRFIPMGALVIKYGMSIGSTIADVRPGEWVHMHNLKSDYIPSHTREQRTPQ
jgi:altronate dehydratase small subunit